MKGRLVYLAYALGWAIVRALPERFARALFRVGGRLAYRRGGKGAQRLATNLGHVLGPDADAAEVAATTRRALESYARYWLEVFRVQDFPRQRLLQRTQVLGRDHMEAAVASGAGAIMALPHLGNWDTAGAWFTLNGVPFTTVAERLEPERLFARFKAFRESLGMEVIALAPPGKGRTRAEELPPFDLLAQRLESGGVLCLLADRDLTARGIDVEFFGDTARFPAGPAALAVRTGAWLVPVGLWFEPDGWGIRFNERIPVPVTGSAEDKIVAMTQQMATAFEAEIREHAEDWHMLQRLWLSDLAPDDPRRVHSTVAT